MALAVVAAAPALDSTGSCRSHARCFCVHTSSSFGRDGGIIGGGRIAAITYCASIIYHVLHDALEYYILLVRSILRPLLFALSLLFRAVASIGTVGSGL